MNVPQTSKKEWLFLGLLSFVFALLWFGPLYTATAEQTSGVTSIIREMFLNESSPELMIGKGVDLIGSFWMVEQVKQMLIHGQDTTLPWMYYPIGFDLGENTGYAWADASLAVPLSLLFGKLGFWNIHVLFVCSLSLFGLMVLFRQFNIPIVLSAGLAVLCFTNPFMIDELNLGRPTQISIWPLALLLAVFIRNERKGFIWWQGVLAGLAMAFACLTYWFTGIAMGTCLLLLFIFWLFVRTDPMKLLLFGLVAATTSLLVVLPLTWPMTRRLLSGRQKYSYRKLLGSPDHQYSWFPLELQTEYSIFSWSDLVYVFKASCQFLPFFVIIVLCCVLKFGWKKKIAWIVLWVFTLGMSLSSGIHFFGLHIPTGLGVLEWIFPPMLRCQFEGRNVIVANLIGFVIVALTLENILSLEYLKVKIQWWAKALGIGFLLYGCSLLPSSDSLSVTAFQPATELNRTLRSSPGAILEFPYMASNYTYVQQMFHKQPIFGGMGFDTVRPVEHKTYTKNHPSIQAISKTFEEGTFNKPLQPEQRKYLLDDGFQWILVYPEYSPMDISRWSHFLGVSGIEIQGIWVFPLRE